MSKFSQLIDEVADQKNHSLSDVLLKAKVLAHQLKSRTFRQRVNSEIDGYKDRSQVPDYRVVRCNIRGDFVGMFQSGVRNVPLSTSILEPEVREDLEYERLGASVTYIEDLLSKDGEVGASLDITMIDYLRAHGVTIGDMILNHAQKRVSKQTLAALLTSVRSRLLEFLLELRDKHPELDKDDNAAARISESDIDSAVGHKIYQNITVYGDTEMGDIYQAG